MSIESKEGKFVYICQPNFEQHRLPIIFKMALVNREKRIATLKLWYLLSWNLLEMKGKVGKDRIMDEKKK